MKADNIKNIISDIDHLPYRAIYLMEHGELENLMR